MNINIPEEFSYLEINEQIGKVLETVYEDKKNCLILGKAGSGKSNTLNLIKAIDKRDGISSLFLAPTGIASVNIEGATIHSVFKLGIHPKKPNHYNLHPDTRAILQNTERIVIDEISMTRADIFDAMDLLCRDAKESDDYFGGMQVVCCGDLYQLPPILGKSSDEISFYTEDYGDNPYFFASPTFKENVGSFVKVILHKIYRQDSIEYKNTLNRIREGTQTEDDLNMINSRVVSHIRYKEKHPNSIYVAPYNNIVDNINKKELRRIESPLIAFNAHVIGYIDPKNFVVSEHIEVKENSKVMLLVNDPSGAYQNGTIGIFKKVINPDTILVDIGGNNVHINRYEFKEYKYEAKHGKLQKVLKGSFKQFPITSAYAFTGHKSQGRTFEEGYVDFSTNVFAEHLVYVMLSRFRDLDKIGLKRKLKHNDIKINPYVKEFMEEM